MHKALKIFQELIDEADEHWEKYWGPTGYWQESVYTIEYKIYVKIRLKNIPLRVDPGKRLYFPEP